MNEVLLGVLGNLAGDLIKWLMENCNATFDIEDGWIVVTLAADTELAKHTSTTRIKLVAIGDGEG